jgi:MFS family permease
MFRASSDVRAWLMWAVPSGLFMTAFFHRPATGTLAKDLMQAFEGGGSMVGALSATYFYPYAALMIPAGVLIDAMGPRRVVAAGGTVMGLGAVLMGLATGHASLFAGRLLIGLGASVTFVGVLKVASVWFPPERFGTLSALTATIGVLGSLMSTAPLAIVAGAIGWRGALWLVGVGTLVNSALCWWLVHDRGPHESGERGMAMRDVWRGAWQVMTNPPTWPPFVTFFCLYAAAGNLMVWVVPFVQDVYGRSRTEATLYAAATPLALLISGPLTGYLSDRVFGRRRLPYVLLCALSLAAWAGFVATLGAIPLWGLYVLFSVMGLFGAAFVLTWPIGREVNPPPLAGVAVAVVNLGGFLGAALTQGPMGTILDAGWTGAVAGGARVYPLAAYRWMFIGCAAFALAATVAALGVRETRGRNIYKKRR